MNYHNVLTIDRATADPNVIALLTPPYKPGITVAALKAVTLLQDRDTDLRGPKAIAARPMEPLICKFCYLHSVYAATAIAHCCSKYTQAITCKKTINCKYNPKDNTVDINDVAPVDVDAIRRVTNDIAGPSDFALTNPVAVIKIEADGSVISGHALLLICNVHYDGTTPIENSLSVKYTLYDPHGCHPAAAANIFADVFAGVISVIFGSFKLKSVENRTRFNLCSTGIQSAERYALGIAGVPVSKISMEKILTFGLCTTFSSMMAALCILLPSMTPAEIEEDLVYFSLQSAALRGKKAMIHPQIIINHAPYVKPEHLAGWNAVVASGSPASKDMAMPASDLWTQDKVGDNMLYIIIKRFNHAMVNWIRVLLPAGEDTKCCCHPNKMGWDVSFRGKTAADPACAQHYNASFSALKKYSVAASV